MNNVPGFDLVLKQQYLEKIESISLDLDSALMLNRRFGVRLSNEWNEIFVKIEEIKAKMEKNAIVALELSNLEIEKE